MAFDASALDRDTRGFISIRTMPAVAGSTANWTFDPPVSTPIARMQRDRRVAHALVLAVGEGLSRRDGDRVAGVHAHRVDVLDRADDHGVVGAVAHDLELELLPAGDRLLDQDLGHRAARERCAATRSPSSSRSCANPLPPPPSVNDGRTING